MFKASDQFRQSDLTSWGIAALVCWALAIFGANVSAMLPDSMLAGLHATRLGGANLQELRTLVADIAEETARLRQDDVTLATRFTLAEREDSRLLERLGALEASVPLLVASEPRRQEIDRTALTAAVASPEGIVRVTDGGEVKVTRRVLNPSPAVQSMPAHLTDAANEPVFGIAVGESTSGTGAAGVWEQLSSKVGTLLHGLEPRVADEPDFTGKRIVAGPVADLAEATNLCERLLDMAIACEPVPYTGVELAP